MEKRRWVTVGNLKVHYYIMGDGPALVMFHPSPHSGELLLPLAKELAFDYTVICVDTPGYGKSDRLNVDPTSLSDYTEVLHIFFKEIEVEQPLLYGSATGAQLAIRYALDYPNEVSHIFLDNAAHFNDNLRAAILRHYFPDLTPVINGSHLRQVWVMVNRMFQYFPWCFAESEYALNRPQLPKEALHMIALDFLKAGGIYHLAYKAAFLHEKGEYVQQLKVPTTIFRWKGSIIKKHIDDLLAFDFPEHVEAVSIPEGHTERNLEMIKLIRSKKEGVLNYQQPEKFSQEPEIKSVIKGKIPNRKIPKISADGLHFFEAWEILKRENPNFSAQEIQNLMVKWFTEI
ncbi:alpha/beta hydrolase [uncultured Maribacter sp.]|uniref:alpha/beta hydrolase n=1 Tax=uncultured Maribacter sp. TaxID=431308 RepID=UPI0026044FD4|nr:alpha/beta hydrolase [uncultured Maribacter sp.]